MVEFARDLAEPPDRLQRRAPGAQLGEQPFPAVAGSRDQLLYDCERGRVAVATAIFELPVETRRMSKPRPLGEEARDLGFRVDAVGKPAERLHDRDLTEDDRRIALLATDAADGKGPRQGCGV